MQKVQKTVWEALLDYDKVCVEWMHEVVRLFLDNEQRHFYHFDKVWGRHQVICIRLGNFVK
jgi:ribosomal silencing factor RsfS